MSHHLIFHSQNIIQNFNFNDIHLPSSIGGFTTAHGHVSVVFAFRSVEAVVIKVVATFNVVVFAQSASVSLVTLAIHVIHGFVTGKVNVSVGAFVTVSLATIAAFSVMPTVEGTSKWRSSHVKLAMFARMRVRAVTRFAVKVILVAVAARPAVDAEELGIAGTVTTLINDLFTVSTNITVCFHKRVLSSSAVGRRAKVESSRTVTNKVDGSRRVLVFNTFTSMTA